MGKQAWDLAVSEQQAIADAGGAVESRALTDQEIEDKISQRVAADAAPIGLGIAIGLILMTLVLTTARGVAPRQDFRPLAIGFAGVALGLFMDIRFRQSTHIGRHHLDPYGAAYGAHILRAAHCGSAFGGK